MTATLIVLAVILLPLAMALAARAMAKETLDMYGNQEENR